MVTQGMMKNANGPISVWNFKQGVYALNVGCHVISTSTTHFGKCVLVIKTH
jgi:hypothetical protein